MRRAMLITGLVTPFLFAVLPLLSLVFATTPPAEELPPGLQVVYTEPTLVEPEGPGVLAMRAASDPQSDCSQGSHTAIDS